jgi:hypothetical protein
MSNGIAAPTENDAESLAGSKKGEALIASLMLTGAEAVGSPLAAAYEKLLKEISVGDR